MTETTSFRETLSRLEAENAALRARIERLEAPVPKPAPRPRKDEGVRVLNLTPGVSRNLPTEDEARALLKIVCARHPVLRWRYTLMQTPDDELESFRAAFAYVTSLTKTKEPVTKYAASWWLDECQAWCRQMGVQGVARSLRPAIVATGDVNFSFDDRDAFWLHPHRSGTPVDDTAWRKLLNGGDLIMPTRVEKFVDRSIGRVHVAADTW
jgi:hypothetical protein